MNCLSPSVVPNRLSILYGRVRPGISRCCACLSVTKRRLCGNAMTQVGARTLREEQMVPRRMRAGLLLLLGLVASTLAGSAQAEDYPTRPVTVFVPLAAGTGMDVIVRLYSD